VIIVPMTVTTEVPQMATEPHLSECRLRFLDAQLDQEINSYEHAELSQEELD